MASADAAPVAHPPARPIALVLLVRPDLRPELLIEAALGLLEALRAVPRDRLRVRGPLGLQAFLGLAQPAAPAGTRRELRRQLITARLAVELVLGLVGRDRPPDELARQLLVIEVLVARRAGLHLRAVDRDHPDLRQAAARAQDQDLAEQARERVLVVGDEARDRRVIWSLLRGDHPERDVLDARPLDRPRRRDPTRVGLEEQRDHHRRVIRRPAAAVDAIGAVERVEVHLGDGVDDKPRQVTCRQPLVDIGRHQKRLLAVTRNEALSHLRMVLNPPDSTDLCDSLKAKAKALRTAGARSRNHAGRVPLVDVI